MSRIVVTGGAGFIGSHLCEAFLARDDRVVCVDNLSSGHLENVQGLLPRDHFEFYEVDICDGIDINGHVDAVVHLASPASPPEYLRRPLETLAVGSRGTEWALNLAFKHDARFLLASTSEVYGEPLVHPQSEKYWGNVNPVGPRSVYDEAKRFSEALTMAYYRTKGANVGIVRIFNTYGPRLYPGDGRVVSNFVSQALSGKALTIYGDGGQTRSFCYVGDMVRGLVAMVDSDVTGPINLGNPVERSIRSLAELVLEITGSSSELVTLPLPEDDPTRRCPDITLARQVLGFEPKVSLEEGLAHTVDWFAQLNDLLG